MFKEAVGGMGDACRALGTPVTGGNVSFYNENPEGAVFPTPTIGMLGLVEDLDAHATTAGFKAEGDVILLVSPAGWHSRNEIGGSEYLAHVHGKTAGDAPHFDLDEEKAVQEAMLTLIRSGLVRSAHDVSDGGLAVALAESVLFSNGLGADVDLPEAHGFRLDAVLFGEAQSRIVFSVSPGDVAATQEAIRGKGVQVQVLGHVVRNGFTSRSGGRNVVELSSEVMRRPYEESIPAVMAS